MVIFILNVSPRVYILVAGFKPDKRFDDKIVKIKGRERVLQIGVRMDIDEVFENIDIYLGTYPMTGGLMTQYAAKHAKPVIAYHDEGDVMNAIEEVVNYYQQEFHSFTAIDAMAAYAEKLIGDEDFRLSQGKLLQEGIMNEERFNQEFYKIITSHQSSFIWQKDQIDYESFFERYLDLENTNGFRATQSLAANLKLSVFTKLNSNRTNIVGSVYDVIKNTPPSRLFRWLSSRITQRLQL